MLEAQGIKVLTIEDDDLLRRSIATYLEDSGFTVYEAANAQEGLALFRQNQPDIVFTDLCMPHGNGLDLLPVLHAESPHTPLVVVSGAGRLNDAVQAMKVGAWDYIDKPVRDLSILEDLVHKLTRQSADMRKQQADLVCFKQSRDVYTHYDALTGLPNRTFLADHFAVLSAREERLTLIHLDLDNFKLMNATLGPQATDKLLQKISVRILQVLADEDMVARIGSDEFAILSPVDEKGLNTLIASLKNVFFEPFGIISELFVTVSMGVVCWPGDGATFDELLKHADMSMLQARRQGNSSVQFYNPAFGKHIQSRIELENNLRRALERNEFTLHYQPQIDIASGAVAGLETLIRWQHKDGRLIPPGEFIPILEESGLIIPVGNWILKNACSQYVAWRLQGMAPICLSVNISAPQFKSGDLPATVIRILAETGMDPTCLCVELTESIVMENIEKTISTLETLRRLGLSLSIDDFGTGYSSLNYLSTMPITELKIDRSFISTIPHDRNNAHIVNTIISMAHSLNLRVVAEGVETAEQLHHLSTRQCQMVQGFYFSKPLPAEKLLEYLAEYEEAA